MKICILGAGSWGTALAQVLIENKHSVSLWHRNPKFIQQLSDSGIHPNLPGADLNPEIHYTSNLSDLSGSDILLLAVPSQALRSVLGKIDFTLPDTIICASKGLETGSGMRMSGVIAETLTMEELRIVALSGPSHAEEVCKKQPTTIVAASTDIQRARKVQEVFSNQYLRVYSSDDLVGVETGGAAKNVIALASGICRGLGLGDNTIAALLTRGLEEIVRLGMKLGAQRTTFSGLSGLGDLVVTAFSDFSRNRRVGFRLGRGESLEEILTTMDMVAEGVETTRSIHELTEKNGVEMPICHEVYQVLFNDKLPRKAIMELMQRELIDEYPE